MTGKMVMPGKMFELQPDEVLGCGAKLELATEISAVCCLKIGHTGNHRNYQGSVLGYEWSGSDLYQQDCKLVEQRIAPDVSFTDDEICQTCNGQTRICFLCNLPEGQCTHQHSLTNKHGLVICPACNGTGKELF